MFSKSVQPLNSQQMAKVINNLIDSSPIYMTKFDNPIIASDLRIYSLSEYESLLIKGFKKSPFSKQTFIESPFPMLYPAFKKYVQSPLISNLIKLATCPVSHKIMKDPVIVCLAYTAPNRKVLKQVVVCDSSSLDFLPESMKIKRRREWAELKDLINFFAEQLAPLGSKTSRTDAKSWYVALRQIKDDFPLLPPSSLRLHVPPLAASASLFEPEEREHKHREHKQSERKQSELRRSDIRQSLFYNPYEIQAEDRSASDQLEYEQLSSDRLELIDVAERVSESASNSGSSRSCFSSCYSRR
jgi:hypothetical protein